MSKKVGDKRIELRERFGVTQEEFAQRLGCSRSNLSRIETSGKITARRWGDFLQKLGLPYESLHDVRNPPAPVAPVLPPAPEVPASPGEREEITKLKQELSDLKHVHEQLQHAIKFGFGDEFAAPIGDISNGRARFVARASQKSNPPYDLVLQWINAVPASRLAWEDTIRQARDTHAQYLHGPSAAYAFFYAWLASQQTAMKTVDTTEKDNQIRDLTTKLNEALGIIEEAGL